MCGIAGIAGDIESNQASKEVRHMLDTLARRGPDDEGVETLGRITLGHRRLAIFDLSRSGHQPMLSDDGSFGIVFNGAIYNFRSLRDELIRRGHRFHSETDTEVLLNGFREWGIDALLSKIDGMFAFGIWDNTQERLYLVRDRLGVKPLAFYAKGDLLVFGSTVRALRWVADGTLDDSAVAEFLEFGFVTDERSIYAGIQKVKPGEVVEWYRGQLTRRTYWDLPATSEHQIPFEEAVEETERLFLNAVEKRLHADVEVGALLSGGIDSSLVCWAISKLGADVTAYTVSTPKDEEDESRAAAETAGILGLRHRILRLSADDSPKISDLTEAFAEPFACASALGMLEISKEARKSVRVMLTGDGGDDVFLGYPEHKHFRLSGNIAKQLPTASTSLWRIARHAVPAVGSLKRAVSLIDYSVGGLGAVGNARDGLPFYQRNNILGERLRNLSIDHREIGWSVESGRNLLSEFLAYDRRTRFTGEYLTKVDGSTMHHALEARSPFLDWKLWEFASQLPYSIRLNGGNSKAILREIARRRIGHRLAVGKKKGFTIPVQRWLTGKWHSHVSNALRDSTLADAGWINSNEALKALSRYVHTGNAPRQLWFLYVLESWFRYEKLGTTL